MQRYKENAHLKDIKLIVLDVDGTMTDGGVYIDNNRVEYKRFHIKDGAGILLAQLVGYQFMILTGRESNCVMQRAKELHIKYVFQGIHDKKTFLKNFMQKNQLQAEQAAYIGDDINDLPAMSLVGITACPADASQDVLQFCTIPLKTNGGHGVIREFVEYLLKKRNLWEDALHKFFISNENNQ